MAEKIINNPDHPVNGTQADSQYITRDEFDLYDTFKTISLIGFFMSMVLMCTAMKGRMGGFYSPRWSGVNNTKRQMRKFGCKIVALLVLCYAAHHYMESIKPIMDKYHPHGPRNHHAPESSTVEPASADGQEEYYQQHHPHNHHHGHGPRNEDKCCMMGPLVVVATLIWHFCNYRSKLSALKKVEEYK